ncbi:MAG TPA: RsmE family RNA methyltransferase [Candidatus Eisenbacteria bacterium]|nr:RsmE family RNA methyltransferase [Candidatus Eisenbacteria bacterium]
MRGARRPDTLFWVDLARVSGNRLSLDADESRHLLRVFRAEPGVLFDATDGAGTRYRCRLAEDHHGEARAEILSRESGAGELPGSIHLIVGLPDMHAAEAIVEHAVPLGATSIVFAACRRSGRELMSDSRLERLERIAVAGVKQSLRSTLPVVGGVASLGIALEAVKGGLHLVADPEGVAMGSRREEWLASLDDLVQPTITLAVGPPGAFDDGEAAELRRVGFHSISLGPNRLTTETASIALLAGARNLLVEWTLPPI